MDLFEYLLAMQKGGGGAKGSSAVYSGKDIVYDSVGQYAYVSTATFPKLKDNDIYFVTETYTSNGYTFKKGSIYVLTQGTGDEFDATLLNEEGITYEEIIDVAKGDLITMNLDGTDRQYRVLKNVSGAVYEVVGMTNLTTSKFAAGSQIYENGILDVYLNSTWYDTLTSTAKAAIVDKTFKQDSWYRSTSTTPGTPKYKGIASTVNYEISLGSASLGNEIARHVYAISMQDIVDYLEVTPEMTSSDTTLTYTNVWLFLWNATSVTGGKFIWTRSAQSDNFNNAIGIDGDSGIVAGNAYYLARDVRPAFQIDLSKIPYTKV